MAQTHIQPGKVLDYTVPTGETYGSGDIIEMGDMVGVTLGAAAAGEEVRVMVEEVHELPKVTADVVAFGDKLYSDGNGKLTVDADDGGTPATAYKYAGRAVEAAGNTATVVKVKLGHP